MFLWFATTSIVLVAIVFRSGAVDYRTVALGALLPWIDVLFGDLHLLHTLLGVVAVLVVVMLVTRDRRLVRRRVLGIPIGLLCHLVLDGSFTNSAMFWWPAFGLSPDGGSIPELAYLNRSLFLELVGAAVTVWAWRRFGLEQPEVRERFLRTGRLDVPE